MLSSLGHETSAVGVAGLYRSLAASLLNDLKDAVAAGRVEQLGLRPRVTDTVMTDAAASRALAAEALAAGGLVA
jgi:LPPG:FO 2-phospho-L-lactate transferase